LSSKYIQSAQYEKAIEILTDAIDLSCKMPMPTTELLHLYNNRSLAYEKLKQYADALEDIELILSMKVNHLEARTRRADIQETMVSLSTMYSTILIITVQPIIG
jgi:tetratricopeptide (TPR) repeat protein